MMRTTLFVGLCCALSAPAAAEFPHSTLALGQFCKSTTSLVSCSSLRYVRRADSLTGFKPIPGLQFAIAESDDKNAYIELAEAQKQKDLQTLLRDYINELLGYKKPAKKPDAAANNATISLPATDLADYIKTRETWGTGEPHEVEAPLASGAVSPLPMTAAKPLPPSKEVQLIEQEASPLPDLHALPKADIEKALTSLFAERESWSAGPQPSAETPSSAASETGSDNPMAAATGDLKKYFAIRDSWGQGAVKEAAHASTPSSDSIKGALSDLFKTRESWGTSPAKSYQSGKLETQMPLAIKGTASLADFIAQRESWGKGPAAVAIDAPLAAGAPRRFAQEKAPKVAPGPADDTIVNEYIETPLPKPSLVSQADIVRARNALLDERASWGTAPSVARQTVTGNLASYIARRERWGKGPAPKPVAAPLAAGASRKLALAESSTPASETPKPVVNETPARPLPAVSSMPGDSIKTALADLFKTREGWGTEPSMSGPRFAGDLNRFIARREAWGKGPAEKPVRAPLAAGASRKLKLAKSAPKVDANPPIINELEAQPAPQLSPVASDVIASSLKDLLSTREGWGSAPSITEARVAGDLAAFIARRERWGTGPEAKRVRAPLAAGASRKLKLAETAPVAKQAPVIINEPAELPLPQLTAVDSAAIGSALKDLFATRESWGTEPAMSEPRFAGDLKRFIARREAWGVGPKPARVRAPLANGAPRKLRLAKALAVKAGKPPIINELEARPEPQLSAVDSAKIGEALKDLFATRQGWGTEPSLSEPRFAGDLKRFIARREAWGAGPRARRVRAPLAKGAPRRLKLAKTRSIPKGKPPIINELEVSPAPQLAPVAPSTIASALKSLFETRVSWGTKPSLAGASPIVTGSTSMTKSLGDYLSMRDKWQTGSASSFEKVAAINPPTASDATERNRCKDDLRKLSGNRSILFANNSAEIASSSNTILDQVVKTINTCGNASVRIEGHTDSIGSAELNKRLSKARAQSVLEYLAKSGVDRSRMTAIGYGESKPIASNATRKSRALNRRIEFVIE